jgi:phospholipid-transporting ATPase
MIQAANVGVGITGEEGMQAASASDYSIGKFHFLRRLLLVHGTWNFERSVKVILYSYYKNICLCLMGLCYAFFSGFSGQTIFDRQVDEIKLKLLSHSDGQLQCTMFSSLLGRP